jgi:glycerol kinase
MGLPKPRERWSSVPPNELLLAIDQGSTSTKALLVDRHGGISHVATSPVSSSYPHPGWVEQPADEIIDSVRRAVATVMDGVDPALIAGVCISSQRESMVLWETGTGRPAGPLVSWQDRRTVQECRTLADRGFGEEVLRRTGLPLDPMFSGPRAKWLLDAAESGRSAVRSGGLQLGTVDSWLLAQLTGEHLTEPGNASRTQLMNLHDLDWDPVMLDLFGVPRAVLPQIVPSAAAFPPIKGLEPLMDGTPVLAVLADSHAALFAHGAWSPGDVKATYGTGSSVMAVCPIEASVPAGLCLTVAWAEEEPTYALEGNIRASGSTFAWLGRAVGQSPAALADVARTVPDNGGVYLVPAFNGLGAPWWDPDAQGLITGLTLGTGIGHLARAALESIAYQVEDVLDAMIQATGPLTDLLADGGASENRDLMQMQADIGGRLVHASALTHLSPLGAAHFGGIACGLWTRDELRRQPRMHSSYTPLIAETARRDLRSRWAAAVSRARVPIKA